MSAVQTSNPNASATTSMNSYSAYATSAFPTDTDQRQYVYLEDAHVSSVLSQDVGRYSVFDVANWFLAKEEMTQKKVQKLCYYAQAWCYSLKNYRLENTDFEAWIHGPVSPALWERFKSFGYDPIRIKGTIASHIADEDVQLLEDVWDTYGELTGNALEALSHRELPWIEARKGYAPDERCSVVISPETMATYYKSIYCGD